jgi:hypothetical protein
MKKLFFRNIFRSNEISVNDEGIAVCPYCNGTGLNAEFELLNEYHEILEFPQSAHCLKCNGKEYADWVEVANGRVDDEMDYLFNELKNISSRGFAQFFGFVYNGYKYQINDEENYQYDNNKNKWFVSTIDDWPGHIESKKELLFWIDKLISAGYIRNYESPQKFAKKNFPSGDIAPVYSHYYDPEYDLEHSAEIKINILNGTDLNIEDLIDMKDRLDILGFTIEDLNEICICDESGENIETDFVFTWRNLLDKFKVPHRNKYSRVSEGALTTD